MVSSDPLREVRARFAAEQRLVAAVQRAESPDPEDVRTWLRGGAMYWEKDHWFVSWGLLLCEAFGQDEIEGNGIRTAIQESDDIARQKFGTIPLRDGAGAEAVAVTAFDGFTGDKLFGFYPSVHDFLSRAPLNGWLLGQERDLSDALAQMTDDDLRAIWSRRAKQPFR